jgi:hypothetical protein
MVNMRHHSNIYWEGLINASIAECFETEVETLCLPNMKQEE